MLTFSTINGIQLHFSTPILQTTWPDATMHNSRLKQMILAAHEKEPGVKISNRGGWQSRDDLMDWPGESIAALKNWVRSCVNHVHSTYSPDAYDEYMAKEGKNLSIRYQAWANVNRRGDWNSTHNHPNCHWSGVYYVQVPADSGDIGFLDPRPAINMLDTGVDVLDLYRQTPHRITPKDGMTVLFPSWLQHQVSTHKGEGDRISIAFNTRFQFTNSASGPY